MADLDTRQRIASFARGLPIAHRVVIGVAAVVLVATAFLFFRWISSPSYAQIAAGLDGSESAEVTDALNSAGIGYKLEGGGSRVLVERSDVGQANQAMADTSVGSDSGGSDGPDVDAFAPEVIQQDSLRRDAERRLESTLERLSFVRDADVSLAVPEPALFTEQEDPVTASVLVNTGRTPSGEETRAMALTVAGAVEGLSLDNVTISDFDGQILHSPGDSGTSGASDNLTLKRQVEASLEAKARRILETTGAGDDSTAVVNAQVNFDETTIEAVTYDPESSVPIRRQLTEEEFLGTGATADGIPGVDGGVTVDEDGDFSYRNTIDVTENGVNQVTTYTVQASGQIEGLNVAVVVDDGTQTGADVPSTGAIQTLVASALGVDEVRGDSIAVEAVPFPALEEGEQEAAAALTTGGDSELDIFGLVGQAVGVLLLIAVTVVLFLLTRRSEGDEASGRAGEEITLELGKPRVALPADDSEAARIREEVIELVQKQPEEIAAMLRGWLAER